MKKIIDDVLNNVSGLQLNLESSSARDMLSNEIYNGIKKFLQIQLPILENEAVMEMVSKELLDKPCVNDAITNGMKKAGYTLEHSGYDIEIGVRDMMFEDSNNKKVLVTFTNR
jgi:hypothetical protein